MEFSANSKKIFFHLLLAVAITGAGSFDVSRAAVPKKNRHVARKKALKKEITPPKPVHNWSAEIKTLPLSEIDEKLATRRSKSARAIKKAFEHLKGKRYSLAVQTARAVTRDPLFADYGKWVEINALILESSDEIERKSYARVPALAQKAIQDLGAFSVRFPFSPFTRQVQKALGDSEILIAEAFLGQKKWRRAEDLYERGFERHSLDGSLGQIRSNIIEHFSDACSTKEVGLCISWVERFLAYFPKGSSEWRAVAKSFPEIAAASKQPRIYGKATISYHAPDLDATAFDAAMSLYMSDRNGDALKSFRAFLENYPKSTFRFRVRYWLGAAMAKDGDKEGAKKVYEELARDSPLTYYGLLASIALNKPMDSSISNEIPQAATHNPFMHPQEVLRLRRAEALVSEQAYDIASTELKEFRARDNLSSPFLMYLAELNAEAKNYNTSFSIMGDLFARGFPGVTSNSAMKIIFPFVHLDTIRRQATPKKLDPILIMSLIKQESAFDESAVSHVGASGLMQLMPATASETAPDVEQADLTNPSINVDVGTRYINKLMARFNGNIVLTLAGYNAGPNAADRWYREFGSKRGMLEFIETIPYKETREYVGSIIRNYYWYAKRLNPEIPARPLSYFWNPANAATPAPAVVAPTAPAKDDADEDAEETAE